MDLEKISIRPYDQLTLPALAFDLEITYAIREEAILWLDGYIETDDKKMLGARSLLLQEGLYGEVAATDLSIQRQTPTKQTWRATLVIALTSLDLEYLETRRMEDRKGDVKIALHLHTVSSENRASISPVYTVPPSSLGLAKQEIRGVYGDTPYSPLIHIQQGMRPQVANEPKLLTGEGTSRSFIAYRLTHYNRDPMITSAHWINDFAPKLGLGEYFVVRIPSGERLIKEAWAYVEDAENCFRQWNTKGVYANCREVGSLLDKMMGEKLGKSTFAYGVKWSRACALFNDLSSVDLHLEDFKKSPKYQPQDVVVTRADAESVLLITKLLVKYAEEVLRGKV